MHDDNLHITLCYFFVSSPLFVVCITLIIIYDKKVDIVIGDNESVLNSI